MASSLYMKHRQIVAIHLDETCMLVIEYPWFHVALLSQIHQVQILVRVGKRYHIVPVAGVQIDFESAFEEIGDGGDTAFRIDFIGVEDGHVAD